MNKLTSSRPKTIDQVKASLPKRHLSEKVFRSIGLISIMMSLMFLFVLFYTTVATPIGNDNIKVTVSV